MLIKVPSKDTEVVVATLSRHVRKLPVVTEALKLVCNRDKEFQSWLSGQHSNNQEPVVKGASLQLELK